MFKNGDDGCESSPWTYVFAGYWCIITVIALTTAFHFSFVLRKIRSQGHVSFGNALGVAILSTLIGSGFLSIVGMCRIGYLFTNTQSQYDSVDWAFSISQALYCCCVVISLICFGLSLLLILLKASSLTRSHKKIKRKLFGGSIFMALVVILGIVPLTLKGLYAYALAFISTWAIILWGLFFIVHNRMKSELRDGSVQGGAVANVLTHLAVITRLVLYGNTGYFISNVLYVIFWVIGQKQKSTMLLGHLNALAVVGQYTALTFVTVIMLLYQTKFLKVKVIDRVRAFSLSTMIPVSKDNSINSTLMPGSKYSINSAMPRGSTKGLAVAMYPSASRSNGSSRPSQATSTPSDATLLDFPCPTTQEDIFKSEHPSPTSPPTEETSSCV
jgi:hypothetical protein